MKNGLFLAMGMAVAGVAISAQVPPNIEA